MDKRTLIATLLIFLIWGVWLYTQEPPPAPAQRAPAQVEPTVGETGSPPPLRRAEKGGKRDVPAARKAPPITVQKLENEVLAVEVESSGGTLRKAVLKNFTTSKAPNSPSVDLIAPGVENPFAMIVSREGGESQVIKGFVEENFNHEENRITYVWQNEERLRIERTFELPAGSYHLNLLTRITNHASHEVREQQGIAWSVFISEGSEGRSFFAPPPDLWQSLTLLSESKLEDPKVKDGDRKEIIGNITWSSLGSRYFLLAVMPTASENARILLEREKTLNGSLLHSALLAPQILFRPGETKEYSHRIFLGPKELDVLEAEGHHLNRSLHLGFFEFFALFLLRLMKFFHGFVHNWGLAIIVLTVVVKIAFFPLSHKSFKSMKEMQRIQPLLKDLQERYKDNKEQLNVQMLKIMREHKVNPLGGCLPMLIQMPIYFALYKVLYSSIELRQAPFFFWIQDLSLRDPFFISPVLMGVAMFFQQKLSPQPPDPMQAKMMQIMPIMFTAFLLFLPSGLVIYIFCNTALSILQQWYVNRTLGAKAPVVTKSIAEATHKA